jgi:hypothetical protein
MNNKLDLMQIIKEMVTEIGDLENIEPYPYSVSKISNTYDESEDTPSFTVNNYEGRFIADINGESVGVLVWVDHLHSSEVGDLDIAPVFSRDGEVYHIGFQVGGKDSQYTKTDMRSYSRILKTVADILAEVVLENDLATRKKNLYLMASSSKEGVRGTDDAKLRYYRAILNYNILPGYRMGEGIYMGMKAIAIQKSK